MAKRFQMAVVIEAFDRVTAPLRKINSKIERMQAPFRKLNLAAKGLFNETGLARVSSAFGRVGRSVGNVAKELQSVAMRVTAVVGAASAAVFKLVSGFTTAGDNAAKTATRLGVGVEWLQEMRFAADRSGVATATFDMAIQRVGRRIGEFAATGKGEAAPALKALGIQIRDATGNIRPLEAMLPEIADGLRKIESPMIRNAIAMKLFDSEGVALVQLLGEGSDGIAALRREARALGLVISEDAAKSSERFQDRLTNLKSIMSGVRNVIAQALLPVVEKLIVRFGAFLLENRAQIGRYAEEFAKRLPDAIQTFTDALKGLMAAAAPIVSVFRWLSETFGTTNTVIGALALIVGGKLIAAIGGLVLALKALGVALALTPVGWFLGAIAAIGAAAFLIADNWDKVGPFFSQIFGGWKKQFKGFIDFVAGVFTLDWERAIGGLVDIFKGAFETITGIFKGAANLLGAGLRLVGLEPSAASLGFSGDGMSARAQPTGRAVAALPGSPGRGGRAEVTVKVEGQRGTRAEVTRNDGVDLGLETGLALGAQ